MPWGKAPANPVSPRAAVNARILRRTTTEAEKRLWWHLRRRLPVEGSHFRRQVPIGSYVADFCCLSARLIVEVDGGGHGYDATAAYDQRRSEALARGGYRVIRFTNAEVFRTIDSVLDTIHAALTAPHSPPPCGEGSGVGVVPHAPPSIGDHPARRGRSRAKSDEPSSATPTSNFFPQGGGESAEP